MASKPLDPINLSSIFEYYLQQSSLKKNKNQLILQMKDLLTLSQFLVNRIVPTMRNIRQTMKDQQKSFKKYKDDFSKSVLQVTQDPKYRQTYYLESSYKHVKHFTHNKQTDKDYIERTLAQKQYKLKFIESENLPKDLIFHKPAKNMRDFSNNRHPHKDYSWFSYFNNKINLFEIVARRFRILVGLKVENQSYKWCIQRIQQRSNRQPIAYLKQYFQDHCMPKIIAKHADSYQQYMLSYYDKYSYCLQLIEINRNICQITQCKFFSQFAKYKHNGRYFQFKFNRPQNSQQPSISINQQQNTQLVLKLQFEKKYIKASFHISGFLVLHNVQYKYENPTVLLNHFQQLMEYGLKFVTFCQNFNRNLDRLKPYVFIKLNGQYWVYDHNKWIIQSNNSMTQQDGIFFGKDIQKKLVFVEIQQSKLSHYSVSSPFLFNLIGFVSKFQFFFSFVYIIQTLLLTNKQKQCQLDFYHFVNNRVQLVFRKKICAQDLMIKYNGPRVNIQDQLSFNSIKLQVQITNDFRFIYFYHFRDPDHRQSYEKQEWRSWFPRQRPEDSHMQIKHVLQALIYMQHNVIFKYVVQKKLKNDSRIVYNIKI